MKATQKMITEMLAPLMRYSSDGDVRCFSTTLDMMIEDAIDTADDQHWQAEHAHSGSAHNMKMAKRASADAKVLKQMRKAVETRLLQCIWTLGKPERSKGSDPRRAYLANVEFDFNT